MAKGIFVTGTDTGAGKTLVAAGLARCLSRRGIKTAVMKAVQTGGTIKEDQLVSDDLEVLISGISLQEPLGLLNPYCLPQACSPHLAARMAGTEIEPHKIIEAYNQLAGRYEAVIVEGAGGLLVPLRDNYLMADLAYDLSLPLLIVADNKLGVINHAVLTVECARNRNLDVKGLVFNQTEPGVPDFIQRDNPEIITQLTKAPLMGIIPCQEGDVITKVRATANLLQDSLVVDSFLMNS